MKIRKIDTYNKNDVKQFINFPFELYKNCKQWVPTMHSDMVLALNKEKHPFYHYSEADFFITESEGKTLGRIAAIHNQNYCNYHKEQTGFFYFFESVEDKEVSQKLFETALAWSKKREITSIFGPRGMTRSSGIGLLVKGFEYLPAMGIPYNFPYYQNLIESFGFQKADDYLSGFMTQSQQLPEKLHLVADKVKERGHFWIKTFSSKAEMQRFIPLINEVHHEAFKNNPGYYPSTDEEFELLAKSMIQVMIPSLVKLIMRDDELAGFIFVYPDISKAIQRTKGKMWPFGWLQLLKEQNRSKIVNINGLGLLPKYQGLGGNALLYVELEKTLLSFGVEKAEIVQVNETNFLSKSDMNTVGTNWCKLHRTYKLSI